MKKILLPLVLISASALSLYSAETKVPVPVKEMSFRQMMSKAFDPAKAQEMRTAKLVYAATSTEYPDAVIVFRARKPGFIRIDAVLADNHYIACQDGTKYWGYDKKKGTAALSKEDVEELRSDFSFLPIPFYATSAFNKLTYVGDGMFRNTKCFRYKVDAGANLDMEAWVDVKTGLLCKVKASDFSGKYATAYRDYRDFDGIKVASTIILSSPMGSMTMQLRSADWNTTLPDKLFTQGSILSDNTLALYQKELIANAANAKALQNAARAKKAEAKKQQTEAIRKEAAEKAQRQAEAQERNRQRNIEKLEREIRILTIEIEQKTERLKKVEDFANSTRKDAAAVASSGSYGRQYYSTWRYGGWGYRRSTGSNSTQKRAARKLGKATAEAIDEYNALSQELTEKRIQLSDAQTALAKLKKQK